MGAPKLLVLHLPGHPHLTAPTDRHVTSQMAMSLPLLLILSIAVGILSLQLSVYRYTTKHITLQGQQLLSQAFQVAETCCACHHKMRLLLSYIIQCSYGLEHSWGYALDGARS